MVGTSTTEVMPCVQASCQKSCAENRPPLGKRSRVPLVAAIFITAAVSIKGMVSVAGESHLANHSWLLTCLLISCPRGGAGLADQL